MGFWLICSRLDNQFTFNSFVSLGSLLWWCLMLHVCLLVFLMCVTLLVKSHLLMDRSFLFFNAWLFRVVCSLLAQSWWRVWKRRWISMNISTRSMALTWVFFPPNSLHGSTFEPRLSIPNELLIVCLSCCFSGGGAILPPLDTAAWTVADLCIITLPYKTALKVLKHTATWFEHSSVLMKSKCSCCEFTLQTHKSSRPVQQLFSSADISSPL